MVRLLPSLRSSSHGLWLLVIGYCLNGGDCKMVAMLIYSIHRTRDPLLNLNDTTPILPPKRLLTTSPA
jgi:hypothetical protein